MQLKETHKRELKEQRKRLNLKRQQKEIKLYDAQYARADEKFFGGDGQYHQSMEEPSNDMNPAPKAPPKEKKISKNIESKRFKSEKWGYRLTAGLLAHGSKEYEIESARAWLTKQ